MRRKPKSKLAEYSRCVVEGCNFPALIEFRGEKFCLRHIRDRIGGSAVVSTHLDVVGAVVPTAQPAKGKSATETLELGGS